MNLFKSLLEGAILQGSVLITKHNREESGIENDWGES